jgi:hypothetical protein
MVRSVDRTFVGQISGSHRQNRAFSCGAANSRCLLLYGHPLFALFGMLGRGRFGYRGGGLGSGGWCLLCGEWHAQLLAVFLGRVDGGEAAGASRSVRSVHNPLILSLLVRALG